MGDAFFTVLMMSGYGTVAAAAALLVMRAFWRTRCSKTALLLLWLVVGIRLVCPWSPPSAVSLFNLDPFARSASQMADAGARIYTGDARRAVNYPDGHYPEGQSREDFDRAVEAGVEPVQNPKSHLWEVHYYENNAGNITPARTLREAYGTALFWIWLAGALGFLSWGCASYLLLRRRLRFAVRDEAPGDVWYSDYIPSPCVAGFVRPQIYLTFGMDEGERACVLAHERQHIQNRDHIWKALGWLVMCPHWFNPLLWMAYRGFLRMIEDACDQRVLRELGEERKADYGQALLSLSAGGRFHPGLSPLAFGEGDTKERVKNVLNYRKPLAWLTGAALVLCAVVGICLLTGRAEDPVPPSIEDAYGAYTPDGVVSLTMLSSSTANYLLEQWDGREIVFTADHFHAGNVDVEGPVYEPMELGDVLHTTEMGEVQSFTDIDLTEYKSVQGWKVRAAGGKDVYTTFGQKTDLRVFAVDGKLWLGRWVWHDNAAIPYGEYWEIIEASRVGAAPSETAPDVPISTDAPYGEYTEVLEGIKVSPAPSEEALDPRSPTAPVVTFTAVVEASDPDMGTLTVRPEQPLDGVERFRFEYWEPSLFKAGDRMYITAHDISAEDGLGGGTIDAAIPLSSVVAEWRADLTHDGVEERVYVTDCGKGAGVSYLIVESTAESSAPNILWLDSASTSHAGQNGYYLYQNPEDGSYYLLNWVPYMGMGMADYHYDLFCLTPEGRMQTKPRRNGAVEFDMSDIWSADPAELRQFDKEINELLSHSVVLLSTNYDTPEGVYWGDPEDPVIPIGPFDSGADYFETRQALAQGTYTFTGEIVGVLENGVVVQDETLWTTICEEVYHFFIPAEALDRPVDTALEGRMVTVTADGPLYRNAPPAEATHVEARLIGSHVIENTGTPTGE